MIKIIHLTLLTATLLIGATCDTDREQFDASGSFETEEIIISSEEMGVIKIFNIEEGASLTKNQWVGYIDSTQLYLSKKRLVAKMNAMLSKRPNIAIQIIPLQEKLKSAEKERKRIKNLVKENSATIKQLDDVTAQVEIIKGQIQAQRSSLNIIRQGIQQEIKPLQIQIEQINDRIQRCNIVSPIQGTVLTKYAQAKEVTSPGKPLYKIADLSTMILRVYLTEDLLSQVKIGQPVSVFTDQKDTSMKETKGIIFWISSTGEFTPKAIQTKEERANNVYAIKIRIENDGSYKLGMYGEVNL